MPTAELARRTTGQVDPADAARISKSKLVPELIADDPASAEYMMRIGQSLGLDPVAAFQHIFVFEDKKTGRLKAGMSAHLMQALALAAGHTVHVEGNAVKATARLVRNTSLQDIHRFNAMREVERQQKQDLLENTERLYRTQRDLIRDQIEDLKVLAELGGEGLDGEIKDLQQQLFNLRKQYDFQELRDQIAETDFDLSKMVHFKSEWTMQRANQAGLVKDGGNWTKYGHEMLKARAKASVVRDGAIDVILGVKRIMSDLGIEFTDDVDDELAVANALYTPEELGAEVDEDGTPIEGRVVNVTAPGVSKTQDRLVAGAKRLIDGKSAGDVKTVIDQTARGDKPADEKISRLDAISKAVNEAGRGDEEVPQEEGTCTLSAYLADAINELNTTHR